MIPTRLSSIRQPGPIVRFGSRLAGDRRGAAVLEFALCASAFLGLLIGTLQIALVFFAQQNLQTSAEIVARKLLTGQITAASTNQAQFKTAACAQLPAYMKCSRLFVDVQKASAFGGVDTSIPALTYDASGNITNVWRYDPGTAGDVVILRLLYQWPVSTAPLGFRIGNQNNGSRLIIGTMVFKSEPYA